MSSDLADSPTLLADLSDTCARLVRLNAALVAKHARDEERIAYLESVLRGIAEDGPNGQIYRRCIEEALKLPA